MSPVKHVVHTCRGWCVHAFALCTHTSCWPCATVVDEPCLLYKVLQGKAQQQHQHLRSLVLAIYKSDHFAAMLFDTTILEMDCRVANWLHDSSTRPGI